MLMINVAREASHGTAATESMRNMIGAGLHESQRQAQAAAIAQQLAAFGPGGRKEQAGRFIEARD